MTDTAGRNEPVMPPGRELDAEIATRVLGYELLSHGEDGTFLVIDGYTDIAAEYEVPHYSTSWDAMRLVVERMVALGWAVAIDIDKDGANCVMVCDVEPFNEPRDEIVFTERGDTAPHAAALAALKAVEASRE